MPRNFRRPEPREYRQLIPKGQVKLSTDSTPTAPNGQGPDQCEYRQIRPKLSDPTLQNSQGSDQPKYLQSKPKLANDILRYYGPLPSSAAPRRGIIADYAIASTTTSAKKPTEDQTRTTRPCSTSWSKEPHSTTSNHEPYFMTSTSAPDPTDLNQDLPITWHGHELPLPRVRSRPPPLTLMILDWNPIKMAYQLTSEEEIRRSENTLQLLRIHLDGTDQEVLEQFQRMRTPARWSASTAPRPQNNPAS